jgi:hypothetical protein
MSSFDDWMPSYDDRVNRPMALLARRIGGEAVAQRPRRIAALDSVDGVP